MASTLNRTGEQKPITDKGHGVESLGPSDSSDSGSDIVGGPGTGQTEDFLPLDTGTNEDADVGRRGATAGGDIGDFNLDSDSDASGTGERASAGKDIATDQDRMPDRIETIPDIDAESDSLASNIPPKPDRPQR